MQIQTKPAKELKVGEIVLLHFNGNITLHLLRAVWTQWETKICRIMSIEPIKWEASLTGFLPDQRKFTLQTLRDNQMIVYDIYNNDEVEV